MMDFLGNGAFYARRLHINKGQDLEQKRLTRYPLWLLLFFPPFLLFFVCFFTWSG